MSSLTFCSFMFITFVAVFSEEENCCLGKCTDADGNELLEEHSALVKQCTQIQLCAKGILLTLDYKCPENAVCGKEDDQVACVCKEGFEWDENKKNCLQKGAAKQLAPCADTDGTVYPTDRSVVANQCTQIKYCAGGKVYAKDYKCPGNTICGQEKGAEACVCAEGSLWNAQLAKCVETKLPIATIRLQAEVVKDLKEAKPCADTDGTVYPTDRSVIVNQCQQIKYCAGGKVYSKEYKCPGNTICGQQKGAEACVCAEGSEWNVQEGQCVGVNKPAQTPAATTKIPQLSTQKASLPCADTDGTVYPTDRSVIVNQCQQIKYCASGKVNAKDYKCPGNTVCGQEKGAEACVCAEGSEWNAEKAICIQVDTPKQAAENTQQQCTDTDDTVYPSNHSVIVNECKQIKHCTGGKIVVKEHKCPGNTICVKKENAEACLCPEGMHWYPREKNCIAIAELKALRLAATPNPKNPNEVRRMKSSAACTDSKGRVYRTDQSTIVASCQRVMFCANEKLYTAKYSCPANSYCGKGEGQIACFCNQGFKWDEEFKNCV